MKNAYEDVIILYMRTKNHIIWCMLPEIWVQHTIFCHFGSFFCPFTPLLAPKIKNWKKIRRYFLFCMCTTNKDSWDITFNRQKFLSFLVIFIPLTNKKIKILRKKAWRYHQLILVYRKWQSYDVWFLSYKVQLTEFFVDYFLPFWPP